MAILRSCGLFFIVCLTLVSGCTRVPPLYEESLKARTVPELQELLLNNETDLDLFRLHGPFAVAIQKDREVRLSSSERIKTDLFLSAP